jgi:Skp family chaperone for outer membrane proteins
MRIKIILAALAATVAFSIPAGAQSQPLKIATVNVGKLFEKYYKKEQADAMFKEFAQGLEKQSKELVGSVQKADKEYRDLLDKSNDQASSADERDKNKQAAERKFREVKDLDQSYQEFTAQAKTKIDEKSRLLAEKLLGEIKDAVAAKAKAGSFSLVIDVAAVGANLAPIVLYSNGENDLTQAVLEQLNAMAPVSTATPKSTAKP